MEQDRIFKTTDLGVAAYIKLKGLTLIGHERNEFIFADPNGEAKSLVIEFANSECNRFDHEIRSLKKMKYN